MMHPNVALDKVGYSYGNDAEELSTGTDIGSASVNQWITVERVFWKASGSSTYRELPIVQDDKIMVRPIPNKNLTLRIYGTQDLSETALSASDTALMGGHFVHMHEAVVHDAGYMATFKDQSLRDEFKLQREEILGLALEQPLVERRTN
jgi:hypothetical protein